MSDFEKGYGNEDKQEDNYTDEIVFHAINFNGLAIFERCIFTKQLVMNYATFNEISQFRYAEFWGGLDLERINIQKHINFFGIKGLVSIQSKKNTSQETFRIIKYNFQQIGNTIQANKFHALELEKYHDWLQKNKTGHRQSLFAFYCHYFSSRYSGEWIRTLCLILVIGLLFAIVENLIELFSLQGKFEPPLLKSRGISLIEDFGKYIWLPYRYNLGGLNLLHAGLLFFNKIFLAYLYYQLITAFRKDTKK